MNPTPETEPPDRQEGGPVRVFRTFPVHRPFARVVRFGKLIASPPRTIGVLGVVLGFGALIVLGTVLLSLPRARVPEAPWRLLDALFTATSAVCVTGLEVVDTGSHWSFFGQAVIMGLIQVGGLGVMTASMLIIIILRRPVSFRDRFQLQETSATSRIHTVSGLVLLTIVATLGLEFLGGLAVWYQLRALDPGSDVVWRSAFHAISAFDNAGFDVMEGGASLALLRRNHLFLLTTAFLVISGGLGMLVLLDIVTKRAWRTLSPTTKIVLATTALLLTLGFVGTLGAEFTNPNTLGPLDLSDKLSNGFFHSVAARTAGFSTAPMNDVHDETQFLTMALMFIGGATGSTAGGIKVSTFVVLLLATWAAARGYEHTSAFGRRFSHRLVYRALAVVALSLMAVFVGTFTLTVTEAFPFRQVLFEVVSALGTVGLTTGITPDLTMAGKLTIVVLMFFGRLGPLTLAYALAQRTREPSYRLPEGDIAIG